MKWLNVCENGRGMFEAEAGTGWGGGRRIVCVINISFSKTSEVDRRREYGEH